MELVELSLECAGCPASVPLGRLEGTVAEIESLRGWRAWCPACVASAKEKTVVVAAALAEASANG